MYAIRSYYAPDDYPEDCGNCDNCLAPPATWDGTEAAQKLLSTVYRTGQRFGAAHRIGRRVQLECEILLCAGDHFAQPVDAVLDRTPLGPVAEHGHAGLPDNRVVRAREIDPLVGDPRPSRRRRYRA